MRMTLTRLSPALLALAAAGCSPAGTGKISGKITVEGKPLPRGLICFESEVGNKDVFNAAIVNGEYSTLEDVPVGPVKAYIVPTQNEIPKETEPGGGDLAPPPKANVGGGRNPGDVPEKYQNAETSGLRLDVKKGDNSLSADLKW